MVDESKRQLGKLEGYRAMWKCPTDGLRGEGNATGLRVGGGCKQIGFQPKGNRAWREVETVRSERQDRRDHWHPEDGQIWIQQAHGTSVAHAGDGRASVYSLLQSEQVRSVPTDEAKSYGG